MPKVEYSLGQILTAKFDLGDPPARGRKGHIFANKGDALIVKAIEDNLTHPLRVCKNKAKDVIFGVNPVEVEVIKNVTTTKTRSKSKSKA